MKPAPLGTLNADLAPSRKIWPRASLRFSSAALSFRLHRAGLLGAARGAALHRARARAGGERYRRLSFLNADQCEQIYNEIAVVLLDFMLERPGGKDMLRGRTFVRTLH